MPDPGPPPACRAVPVSAARSASGGDDLGPGIWICQGMAASLAGRVAAADRCCADAQAALVAAQSGRIDWLGGLLLGSAGAVAGAAAAIGLGALRAAGR